MDQQKNSQSLVYGVLGIILQVVGLMGAPAAVHTLPFDPRTNVLLMLAVGILGTVLLIAGFSYYAQAKGHSGWWGLVGILGLLGLIVLGLLPDRHGSIERVRSTNARISDLPEPGGYEFRCLQCKYQLNAVVGASCPECGRGFDPDDLTTVAIVGIDPPRAPWTARWSVIIGLLGIMMSFAPFCGPIVPIIGVLFGHLAFYAIKKADGRLPGKGTAITGLIFSYIGLAISIVVTATFMSGP